jgi:hypothetical protein
LRKELMMKLDTQEVQENVQEVDQEGEFEDDD